MKIVLDASAAMAFALQKAEEKKIEEYLLKADIIFAPDIFISEITNVFWKHHQFENLPIIICEDLLEKTINLVDSYANTKDFFQEALSLSCTVKHSAYDMMYLVLARRENAYLLTLDKKLQKIAEAHSIKVSN